MENEIISIYSKEEFQKLFLQSLEEYEMKKRLAESENKSYSINQVAKKLGRSHGKISGLIRQGLLKTIEGNRVTEGALNQYLQKQNL
jgi:hypothetical protein